MGVTLDSAILSTIYYSKSNTRRKSQFIDKIILVFMFEQIYQYFSHGDLADPSELIR